MTEEETILTRLRIIGLHVVENWQKQRWEIIADDILLGWCSFRLGVDGFIYWANDRFLRW